MGSSARRGRKRGAWTQTPRCRAAPLCGPPGELRRRRRREAEEAGGGERERKDGRKEEELLLGCI